MTLFWIQFVIHFRELCIHFMSFENSFFKKYVVSIKCCKLFDNEQCTVNYCGEKESKKCSFVKFPNHPLKQYRKQCGQLLMKSVKSPSGKSILLLLKTYCYRSLKKSLELLLSRDGFEIDCEKWRNLEKDSDVLVDVYDGNKTSEILLLYSMLIGSSHSSI